MKREMTLEEKLNQPLSLMKQEKYIKLYNRMRKYYGGLPPSNPASQDSKKPQADTTSK